MGEVPDGMGQVLQRDRQGGGLGGQVPEQELRGAVLPPGRIFNGDDPPVVDADAVEVQVIAFRSFFLLTCDYFPASLLSRPARGVRRPRMEMSTPLISAPMMSISAVRFSHIISTMTVPRAP